MPICASGDGRNDHIEGNIPYESSESTEYSTNPFLSVVQLTQIVINTNLTEISCMLFLARHTLF